MARTSRKIASFLAVGFVSDQTYYGSPFPPLDKLSVSLEHFEKWLKLFDETVDSLFAGEKSERAKWKGERMAEMFHSKIK